MFKNFNVLLFCLLALNSFAKENVKMDLNSQKKVSFDSFNGKRFYFAHQSVGNNLINGLKTLNLENSDFKINIVEKRDSIPSDESIFLHGNIGKNEDPDSKIDGFGEAIINGIGNKVDYAFLKLCYIDFKPDTDIDRLFKKYADLIDELSEKYKETNFIHFTVPVAQHDRDLVTKLKEILKSLMGKKNINELSNNKRNEYNDLLRKKYGNGALLFDIARYESTRLDGTRESYKSKGRTYYSLVKAYTDDGGHLNDLGQKVIATEFINFVKKLSSNVKATENGGDEQ